MDPDAELLKLIAAGGKPAELAFKTLFQKYRKPFLGFLMARRVDAGTAEDLVQEAFIKIAKAAGSFRGDSKASSWMFTILRHVHLDKVRKLDPEETHDEDEWNVIESEAVAKGSLTPEEQVGRRQLDDCLERQYQVFSTDHADAATALAKVTDDGWSIRDLAQFLGRTEAATKEYLSQCRKKLRRLLEPCRELYGAFK